MASPAFPERGGYLTVDALVALGVTTVAVVGAVSVAGHVVVQTSNARDRLTAMRVADDIYEGLYAGDRPDGLQSGITEGRAWTYKVSSAARDGRPSIARQARIVVDRRRSPDLVVEAILPPAPAIPSSNL